MGDWLWRDESRGLGLRVENDTNDAEAHLELRIDADTRVSLDAEAAIELAEALRAWARPAAPSHDEPERPTPEGTWFQVYYSHEYADADGSIVAIQALGEPQDGGAYTWDEDDTAALRERVRLVGRALADLHEATTGQAWGPDVDEAGRAWISVFRMPDDVRVWKGFWNDFEEIGDDELLSGP